MYTNLRRKEIHTDVLGDYQIHCRKICFRKGDDNMPLSMVKAGEPNVIKKVGGKSETKKFLENLGFVVGGLVTVISEINGSLIVNVKDSRVAIGKDMANKILV